MRLVGLRLSFCVACTAGGLLSSSASAESYTTTATTTLAVRDGGVIQQTWTASCEAVDVPEAGALITPGGKDLRFVAAPDEVLAVSVDDATYDVAEPASGVYDYDAVVGAHVFARFTARCGSVDVGDTEVVESVAVVTAPRLDAPFSIRRTDTLEAVDVDELPAGVEVELVDLTVTARPRGSEVVELKLVDDDGVELGALQLGATDLGVLGSAVVSPRVTVLSGGVHVTAELLGAVSAPLEFHVGGDIGEGEGEGDGIDDEPAGSSGCAEGGAVSAAPGFVLALLLRRRRRG